MNKSGSLLDQYTKNYKKAAKGGSIVPSTSALEEFAANSARQADLGKEEARTFQPQPPAEMPRATTLARLKQATEGLETAIGENGENLDPRHLRENRKLDGPK